MADHFAVIDVGSNAMKFQIGVLDQPKRYRVVEQDRQPVRLGHNVFRTGHLDPANVEAALKALADFKTVADKYQVKAIQAVGTSGLREACEGESFLKDAHQLGVPMQILSAEDEARLISLGIMSGLRFHLPLGLFLGHWRRQCRTSRCKSKQYLLLIQYSPRSGSFDRRAIHR